MNKSKINLDSWTARNRKNSVHLKYWSAAWLVSMALAAFGPKYIWDFNALLTIFAVIISIEVVGTMIVTTKRYLSGLDEMHQKIFREVSAITLGIGVVCGNSYELLEDIKLISFEPEISHLIILICLTFLAAMIVGHRDYR
jgi:hypothetical protein